MLNLPEGHSELESVRDRVSQRYKVCFNSTTFKIPTFVNGVWCCCGYWFNQTSAANTGRLKEPKHVINNTMNHMEITQCVIHSARCCGSSSSSSIFFFFSLFHGGSQLSRLTSSECGFSDRISNASSKRLVHIFTWSRHPLMSLRTDVETGSEQNLKSLGG